MFLNIPKFLHCEGGEALNRLPREAVDAPPELFKARLDGALSTLV